jgi:hypothetical protein
MKERTAAAAAAAKVWPYRLLQEKKAKKKLIITEHKVSSHSSQFLQLHCYMRCKGQLVRRAT